MYFATVIGGTIAFYLIYAFFALFFKHKIGLIVSGVLWALAGFALVIARQDGFAIVSATLGSLAVLVIRQIQIRSPEKEAKRANKKNDPPKDDPS